MWLLTDMCGEVILTALPVSLFFGQMKPTTHGNRETTKMQPIGSAREWHSYIRKAGDILLEEGPSDSETETEDLDNE